MRRKAPALRNIGIDRHERALERFSCDYLVEPIHGCPHRFLADFAYQGRELIYCDPPYLHATRSGERHYRYDCEESDHIALLQLLKTLSCPVILSGYPSALYHESLPDWQSQELQVMNPAGIPQRYFCGLDPRPCLTVAMASITSAINAFSTDTSRY